MKAKSFTSFVSASALASFLAFQPGCASVSQQVSQPIVESVRDTSSIPYEPKALPPSAEYADTNTLPISSGTREYRFKQAKVGEIVAENEAYVLVPFAPGMTIETNGKTLDSMLVLDAKFIPHNNSRYIRTQDEVKVMDNGEVYFAANVYNDGQGNMVVNTGSQERSSFFVVSPMQFPQSVTRNDLQIEQQRLLNDVMKKAGYVKINGERYISMPADNPFGPDRVFIPLERAQATYVEERKPDYVKVKFGLNGPGYFLLQGKEKEMPSREPAVSELEVKEMTPSPLENASATSPPPL